MSWIHEKYAKLMVGKKIKRIQTKIGQPWFKIHYTDGTYTRVSFDKNAWSEYCNCREHKRVVGSMCVTHYHKNNTVCQSTQKKLTPKPLLQKRLKSKNKKKV